MEISSEQTEPIATETGEKTCKSETPAGEVTTSDSGQVSSGGDAPVSTQGQSSKDSEEEDETTSDPKQGESTVMEGTSDDVSASEPSQGDSNSEPTEDPPAKSVEETETEKAEDVAETSPDDPEKKPEEDDETSQASEDVETTKDADPGSGVETSDGPAESVPVTEELSSSEETKPEEEESKGEEEEDEKKEDEKEEESRDDAKDEMGQEEEKDDAKDEEYEKISEADDGENDEVNLLSEVEDEESKPSEEAPAEDEKASGESAAPPIEEPVEAKPEEDTGDNDDALLKEDKDTGDDEMGQDITAVKEIGKDDDALLKEDKDTGGDGTGQDITAAEEEDLLKETEEDKMEQEEAMDVEDKVPSAEVKGEDDVESMEVDEEPKDVEMRSEPGSVAAQDEDKDVAMEPEEASVDSAKVEDESTGVDSAEVEDKSAAAEESSDDQAQKQSTEMDKDAPETVTTETKTDEANKDDADKPASETEPEQKQEAESSQEKSEPEKEGSPKPASEAESSSQDQSSKETTSEESSSKTEEAKGVSEEKAEVEESSKVEGADGPSEEKTSTEVESSSKAEGASEEKTPTEVEGKSSSKVEEGEGASEEKTSAEGGQSSKVDEAESDEKTSADDKSSSKAEGVLEEKTPTEGKGESSSKVKEAEEQTSMEIDAGSEQKTSEAETAKDAKADGSNDAPVTADTPVAAGEDGDSGSNSQDTGKSPVTVGGGGEKKVVKKGKVGFSLGNIVSQLKKKAEKDEEGGEKDAESMDTTEASDADKSKEAAASSSSPTTPAGSSRRKQHKTSAQHITKDTEDGAKGKEGGNDDDDDDIVKIVDEKPSENKGQMKNYATDTMNELLGMFGFDKVDQQESDGIKLGEQFTGKPTAASKTAPGSEVKRTKTPIVGKETKVPDKKIHCTECKQPVTGNTNLGWGSQPFCSPKCLTNYQNRQTSVCEYCNGLISQTSRGKHTKEMQTGQRKEFCSPQCITEYTKRLKTCAHCAKELKAADLIVAPVGNQNKFKEFCNQGCVDAYEKKRQAHDNSSKGNVHPCAVCNKSVKVKHEINYQNNIHRLCSNDCFNKFRTKHSLALNFCEQCGVICYNENLVPNVFLDGKMKKFCSQRCFGEYKAKNRHQVPCYNCKKSNTNHNMIEETGLAGDVRLFCTMQCLQTAKTKPPAPAAATRTPTTKAAAKSQAGLNSATQAAPCDHCRKNQRPLYHLTMSDNTIRNFCSYPCVIAFQAQFNVPPVTLPQETLMLKCAFCSTGFIHKPLTLEYKGSISLFCTQGCFDEFKRSNSVVVQCDYCHLEKILHDRSFFSGMAKSFCSEGCKLLFKQQFAQRLGLKCIVCDYCAQTCRSTVEMVYNKTRRRFCGIACRDKYDKWFNKTARCDGCKLMGRTLSETFMWRDEIKKVCDQKCLLLFYTQQNLPNMTTQGQVQIQGGGQQPVKATKSTAGQQSSGTPVIANVMSLASLNQQQQSPMTKTVMRTTIPVAKATKQTQITTAPPKIKPPPPPPAPLPPAPKMVRNKITLCKPFTQTKSVSCRPVHQHKSCQTDGPRHPILVPIPVPIYIPVPMQMYTTPVPFPVGINTPVPVPMFLPVAAANADKLIETIKEIKEKTPSDPLEAELLMMADAIAGDDQDQDDNKSSSIAADEDSSTTHDYSTTKDEPADDFSSITMEEAEDVIPSDILAEDILQMAAEMTNVLEEDQQLSEDIATLQAPDRPPTPVKPKPKRGRSKRSKGGRNKRYVVDSDDDPQQAGQIAPVPTKSKEDAKQSVGINAFRYFIQAKLNTMSERKKKRNKMLRPNVLDCATEELYFGLCMFIKEARQPNGERYPPDMLLLIFLSIQRELFDNERPENIFTDYEQFTVLVHKEVKDWKPIMDPTSDLVTNSLVDEDSLWNSKQLGAHSPYILLSTLLYFNTKCFRLNGTEQHKELAFVRVQKHLRKTDAGRTMYLRYFPKEMMKKIQGTEGGKRKRERDDSLDLPEQCENTDNPLRCPVKLYEFYLSKCPESVKTRTDLFYLVPERSCIPDSPVWYTCQPLTDKDMNHILSRIMVTKDIHETWAAAANRYEEEYYSD